MGTRHAQSDPEMGTQVAPIHHPYPTDKRPPLRTVALRASPPVPWVAIRLLQTFAEDYDSIRLEDVVRLVRTDPALTTEVLRRVNSALYALPSRIEDLGRAAVMLGLTELRQVTLKAALRCFGEKKANSRHVRRCWRHSLACAHFGEEIAHVFPLQPDLVYVAGLLHNIGRMILLHEFPNEYGRLLDEAQVSSVDLQLKEQELFGMDHSQVGAALARQSHLPERLIEITAHHHASRPGKAFDVVGIVQVSCRLADAVGFGCSGAVPDERPEEVILTLPDVEGALIMNALDEVIESVRMKIAMEE